MWEQKLETWHNWPRRVESATQLTLLELTVFFTVSSFSRTEKPCIHAACSVICDGTYHHIRKRPLIAQTVVFFSISLWIHTMNRCTQLSQPHTGALHSSHFGAFLRAAAP
jgi:hypothetical protein